MADMPSIARSSSSSSSSTSASSHAANGRWSIVLHGGAGMLDSTTLNRAPYAASMRACLQRGVALLAAGHSSLDAVIAVISALEDDPLFNAGVGSVFTAAGEHELDASLMQGRDRSAGACCGITCVRNPIRLARAVMQNTPHVMLAGKGAEAWARERAQQQQKNEQNHASLIFNGLSLPHLDSDSEIEIVENSYFDRPERWKALNVWREKQGLPALSNERLARVEQPLPQGLAEHNAKHGTVGCVAFDQFGNITAGTSTGGTTGKLNGRIGDSPIIGAGVYADNRSIGVSSTGYGEYFMRSCLAKEMSDVTLYGVHAGLSLDESMRLVIKESLQPLGPEGLGGVIVIDRFGTISTPFNTSGMFRAFQTHEDTRSHVAIFENEED